MTTAPPRHPQPSIYDEVVADLGINPEVDGRPRSHQEFMLERNQQGWLGYTMLKHDKAKTTKPKNGARS